MGFTNERNACRDLLGRVRGTGQLAAELDDRGRREDGF
jgi:hypothetical protein